MTSSASPSADVVIVGGAVMGSSTAYHLLADSGFKGRVANYLEGWFEKRDDLKDKLEEITNTLWEQLVIAPMRRLVAENAPEVSATGNVIPFPTKAA